MNTHRVLAAALLTVATASGCGASGLPSPFTKQALAAKAEALFKGAETVNAVISYDTKKQLQAMVNAGMDAEGIDPKAQKFRTTVDRTQFDAISRLGGQVSRDLFPPKNDYDKAYRTYAQAVSELKGYAIKKPEIAEVVDVGDSWEKTQKKADRDIVAIHITKKGGEKKPVVLFAGCHHARELATPEMILYMAKELTEKYGTDPEITAMVDTRDIWLVPMVNPDGHALAEKGNDQRKNTNTATGGKSRIGVDLNRNYGGPEWGNVGCSHNKESDTFCGTGGFSEPETVAMRELMRKIKPTYLLTLHSFSNMVLWPWGYTDAPPPDKRLELVGKKLGELSGYEAGQSGPALYATAGDDTDWAYQELGTLAYTVEIGKWGDGFDPPYSKMSQFWKENRPMFMLCLKTADNPSAAAGPELVAGARTAGAEYFMGRPGRPGTGAALPAVGGPRQLVWGHARDAKGAWGPWSISWSR